MPSIFSETNGSFSFLRTVPARKPRTECCCQPVALTRASRLAPSGRRSNTKTLSCLDAAAASLLPGFLVTFNLAAVEAFLLAFGLLATRWRLVGDFDRAGCTTSSTPAAQLASTLSVDSAGASTAMALRQVL